MIPKPASCGGPAGDRARAATTNAIQTDLPRSRSVQIRPLRATHYSGEVHMRRFVTVPATIAAAALVLAACNGGDDEPTVDQDPEVETTPGEDEGTTEEVPEDETLPDDQQGDDLGAQDDGLGAQDDGLGAQDEEVIDGDGEDGQPEAGGLEFGSDNGDVDDEGDADDDGDDQESSGRATPQDASVDAAARHPGGTLFDISDVSFSGAEIRLEAELLNGSEGDVQISTSGGARMRLVDDLGNNYNSVVPDEFRDRNLELSQGESISGEWVFIGPVDSNASDLTFAANTRQANPVGSDMDDHHTGSSSPVLVLGGIELDW